MEFLKALFADGEALTYDQLVAKATAAKINAVDLSKGGYVSLDKHNDKVNALTQQVEALNGQITKRDTDLADLQTKLTAAQADASKLGEVQTAMTDLQGRYGRAALHVGVYSAGVCVPQADRPADGLPGTAYG